MISFMAPKKTHVQLIGIQLLPVSYIPQCLNTNLLNRGKLIGSVYISTEDAACSSLRKSIDMITDAPTDFRFLNSAGWPFETNLEDIVKISDCIISGVVTIQKQHGKFSRIGIKLLNGPVIGFIFLNFQYEISNIRNLIMSELKDQFESDDTFEFIENNSWPVRKSQENKLSVWDLVVNNCIIIEKKKVKRNNEYDDASDKRSKRNKRLPIEMTRKDNNLNSYSILISYVHGEASAYARDLKNELKRMGFMNIFLDVDDIPAGQDWQDVISLAVHNCSIFVALVTPRYGETRWTNREAKLADDKEKKIIPISFLDKWPPDQLAIQFVTLQYIPWKSSKDISGSSFNEINNTVWNSTSVQRVANEIKNELKKLSAESDISTPDSASLLDHTNSASSNFSMEPVHKQRNHIKKGHSDFIVISAHLQQKSFVKNVTKMLENIGYKTWSSCNMCEVNEIKFSQIEDTLQIGSPISESSGLSTFTSPFEDKGLAINATEDLSNNIKQLKKEFKDKVKLAKVLILIFSEDYLKSSICRQQLFYCEQRKAAIVIKHGKVQIDSLILNLYPEHEMICSENWKSIKFKIEEKIKFDSEDSYRSYIMLSVSKLKTILDSNSAVYIIGGTKFVSKSAEAFSMVLGTELAKVKNLCIATEGFNGAGDLVGKNFCEEQQIRDKGSPPNVYHIIPTRDTIDFSDKAKQNNDGSFEKLPYGNTLYYGMSVSNRDDIVAAAFKLCILIEGGERSACLAEKFLWNDCIVIPVLYNNVTVKNKQCLKESINKIPNDVNENDWQNLNKQNCSPEEKAKAVKRIVCTLLNLSV